MITVTTITTATPQNGFRAALTIQSHIIRRPVQHNLRAGRTVIVALW